MKKRTIIIVILLAILLGALAMVFLSQNSDQPEVLASPTATADSLSADRAIVTSLSEDLAVKYRTFKPPEPAQYLATIKPYVTEELLSRITETLRYADRAPFLQPVRSEVISSDVTGSSAEGTAEATVKLKSFDLKSDRLFEQTLKITWEKTGDRWVATDIVTTEFPEDGPDA